MKKLERRWIKKMLRGIWISRCSVHETPPELDADIMMMVHAAMRLDDRWRQVMEPITGPGVKTTTILYFSWKKSFLFSYFAESGTSCTLVILRTIFSLHLHRFFLKKKKKLKDSEDSSCAVVDQPGYYFFAGSQFIWVIAIDHVVSRWHWSSARLNSSVMRFPPLALLVWDISLCAASLLVLYQSRVRSVCRNRLAHPRFFFNSFDLFWCLCVLTIR